MTPRTQMASDAGCRWKKALVFAGVSIGAVLFCVTAPLVAMHRAWGRDLAAAQTAETPASTIRRILDAGGETLSYDDLMEISRLIAAQQGPVPDLESLLRAMIRQRNGNPRVDQMILIFAARAVGDSRFPLADAAGLFDALMGQEARINEWVLSYIADALARYPFDLPQGVRLVTDLEALHRRVRQRQDPSEELFGYHFLPPPKSAAVRGYIAGIQDRRLRQLERFRYYTLVHNGIEERDIATSLIYLMRNGMPGGGTPCTPYMKCLVRHQHRLPLGSASP